MKTFSYGGRNYQIDQSGFLVNYNDWDEGFAEGMTASMGIEEGLTVRHWEVINFIRKSYQDTGQCPLLYLTCRKNNLHLSDLSRLFPTGYQRGACKLAGLSYRESNLGRMPMAEREKGEAQTEEKTYVIDVRGFLTNPDDWDEDFAIHRAMESKIAGGTITDKHWEIIRFVRAYFKEFGEIPTVYKTCEEYNLEYDQLERLFPEGYHRGVIKISGLRL